MKLKCFLKIEMKSFIEGAAHPAGGTGIAGFFQKKASKKVSSIRIHQTCPE